MKGFVELRRAAGLGNRMDFMIECQVSERTLVDYDNDKRNPPIVLVKYLRLLANGCKLCPLARHNATKTTTEE